MRALSSVALYAFTVALSLRVVSAAITPFLSSSTAKGFLLPCARRNTLRHEEIALETLYNATAGKTWLIRDGGCSETWITVNGSASAALFSTAQEVGSFM